MTNFAELGIMAYRAGKYTEAIELLTQALDADVNNWLARLYLGMSFQQANKLFDAQRVFARIKKDCPDNDLKDKASQGLTLVEKQINQTLSQMKTQELPKTPKKPHRTDDDDDILWIG